MISLSWGLEGYDQGAHGWYTLYYMNYYTQTGERITFDSLGSGFRDKALELVTAKAAEMQAKEDCFFNDYEKSIKLVVLDGTEDLNAIYQEIYGPDIAGTDNGPADPTFYITEDGFVFESGQYVLQSYAVGIVDFEIPAADFGDDLTADILMEYRMLAGIFANIGLYMGGHRVYNKNIGNEVLPEAQASNRRNLNI